MVHKALDIAQPGNVIVVDAGGDLSNAIIGELMQSYVIQPKLGGIVINVAVSFDGMVVEPRDLMIGDNDGILCIPFDQVDAVLEAAAAKQAAEATQMADILAGRSDRSWVDASLQRLGCTTTG